MSPSLARWTPRRVRRLWGTGLLLEAALLLLAFALLRAPEPPIVDRLQGRDPRRAQTIAFGAGGAPSAHATAPAAVEEDSFYTVLRWPPHRPLLAGGGRVIAMPMRRWWVPALYVGAVPLGLLAVSGAWLVARARGSGRA